MYFPVVVFTQIFFHISRPVPRSRIHQSFHEPLEPPQCLLNFLYYASSSPYRLLLQIFVICLVRYLPPRSLHTVIYSKEAFRKGHDNWVLVVVQAKVEAGNELVTAKKILVQRAEVSDEGCFGAVPSWAGGGGRGRGGNHHAGAGGGAFRARCPAWGVACAGQETGSLVFGVHVGQFLKSKS